MTIPWTSGRATVVNKTGDHGDYDNGMGYTGDHVDYDKGVGYAGDHGDYDKGWVYW